MMTRPRRPTGVGGRAGWALAELLLTAACLGTLLVGALGALELASAIRQRAPLELSYSELVERRPDDTWVRVVDGTVDFDLYLAVENGAGDVERLFAPLRPAGWRRGARAAGLADVPVLVSIDGSEAHRRARTDDLVRGLGAVWTGGTERRAVEGVAHVVTRLSGAERRALEPIERDLAGRLIVIDEGERPNALLAIAMLFGSVIAGLALFAVAHAMSPHRQYHSASWLQALGMGGARPRHRARRRR